MNVDPSFMSLRDWADITGSEIERRFRAIMPLIEPMGDWRDWARIVIDVPGLAEQNPPRPDAYDDFVGWARAFNSAVRL